jgi:hypothetical protein
MSDKYKTDDEVYLDYLKRVENIEENFYNTKGDLALNYRTIKVVMIEMDYHNVYEKISKSREEVIRLIIKVLKFHVSETIRMISFGKKLEGADIAWFEFHKESLVAARKDGLLNDSLDYDKTIEILSSEEYKERGLEIRKKEL